MVLENEDAGQSESPPNQEVAIDELLNSAALAARIVELRGRFDWNQADLAREAKITSAALSQIEKGGRLPTLPVTAKIARALRVSVDELIGIVPVSQDALLQELQSFKAKNKEFGAVSEPIHQKLRELAIEFAKEES